MPTVKPHKPYVVTSEKIKYWFKQLNKHIFNDEIPAPRNIILIDKVQTCVAQCKTSDAQSGPKWWDLQMYRNFSQFIIFLDTLAHELVHAHNYWNQNEQFFSTTAEHGKLFHAWRKQLKKFGIVLESKIDFDKSKSNPTKFLEYCRKIKNN